MSEHIAFTLTRDGMPMFGKTYRLAADADAAAWALNLSGDGHNYGYIATTN